MARRGLTGGRVFGSTASKLLGLLGSKSWTADIQQGCNDVACRKPSPPGAARCGRRQHNLQLPAHYRRPANRYVRSTVADITTLHDLRCHPLNHFKDCRRLGSVRCASTPTIGHNPGCLGYGCQFSRFPRIPHLTSLAFRHGSQNLPPACSPVSIRGTPLDGISLRCLICWLRGTGFSTYVLPFVETSARLNLPLILHSSCLEAAAATLQGPFVLPSSPQLISPWRTQHPRSGYIDVPRVPVDIAMECSSAVGRFPDLSSNSTSRTVPVT